MVYAKKHLSDEGFNEIVNLRDELRALGKKAKTYYGNVGESDKNRVSNLWKTRGCGKTACPVLERIIMVTL